MFDNWWNDFSADNYWATASRFRICRDAYIAGLRRAADIVNGYRHESSADMNDAIVKAICDEANI